jgi:eukaryotic-like serine/threonine-protein kinase
MLVIGDELIERTQVLSSPPALTSHSDTPTFPKPHQVLSSSLFEEPSPLLPRVGDELFGFELVEEIGRGGFGGVYLARERALADRPVALKVFVGPDVEAQHLARLQHPNIMPVHSVHQSRGVVGVCMPYFGRTTLADLCSSLDSLRNPPHSGDHLVSTLKARRESTRVDSPRPLRISRPDTSAPDADRGVVQLTKLRSMSHVDAVLWLGRGVASGLAHAHERGLVHRDVKPANVLLADDGQPLILDFNLAAAADDPQAARGGTLPYMSPEQLRLMSGRDELVDHRTDIYSLGVLLAQLLTGHFPFPSPVAESGNPLHALLSQRVGPPPRLRDANPAISPAVEAIVHKCLAADAGRRYQTATELVEDLNRQLNRQPLVHAPNPSGRELVAKWATRNRWLLALGVTGGMACAGYGAFGVFTTRQAEERRTADAISAAEQFARDARQVRSLLATAAADPVGFDAGVQKAEKLLARLDVCDRKRWW